MWVNTARQFARFSFVGAINTAVDFLVLNILITIFGLAQQDPHYIYLKAISFTVTVINSFIWNKKFVFKKSVSAKNTKFNTHKEIWKFIMVSIVGLFINTIIAHFMFVVLGNFNQNITPRIAANIGALAGSAIVLISNFFGYKYLVFIK
ncbi:MAG: GtrA family protein [bacterium]